MKHLLRSQQGMTIQREERKHFWNGLYARKEGADSVEATRGLYQETLLTCFGTKDLPESEPRLPSVADPRHRNTSCLTKRGRVSVARILTAFAYNNPDVQYCPLLYPLTAIIRHYLTGTYVERGFISLKRV